MPSLRVLQVRNSPITSDTQINTNQLTHVTKAFADDFLDFALGTIEEDKSCPRLTSNLKALIIGTQSYRRHWRLQHVSKNNTDPPHFRADLAQDRPIVFGITFAQGVFGSRVFGLEQVEFQSVDELEGFIPVAFMNSVWLLNSIDQFHNHPGW